MKFLLLSVFALILFGSCGSEEGEKLVGVEGRYAMSVPAFLSEVDDLHDEASLQYQHGAKEFYLIVIDELKDEVHASIDAGFLGDIYSPDIEGYSDLIMDNFRDAVPDAEEEHLNETTIHGMPAKLMKATGTVDGLEIYFYLGQYEGDDRYYQVMAWTLASREARYGEKMEKILHSLREA